MQRAAETSAGNPSTSEPVADWSDIVESLYRSHFPSLCRCARRYLDTTHAAEEVVQEAFVRFSALVDRPKVGNELSYLRSIVMNEARSTLRRRVVASRYRFASVDVAALDETVESALRRDDAHDLHHHLAMLPLRQRQVIVLRHLEGLSEQETASLLSISPGSVKTHTSRAMRAMRLKVGVAA